MKDAFKITGESFGLYHLKRQMSFLIPTLIILSLVYFAFVPSDFKSEGAYALAGYVLIVAFTIYMSVVLYQGNMNVNTISDKSEYKALRIWITLEAVFSSIGIFTLLNLLVLPTWILVVVNCLAALVLNALQIRSVDFFYEKVRRDFHARFKEQIEDPEVKRLYDKVLGIEMNTEFSVKKSVVKEQNGILLYRFVVSVLVGVFLSSLF